MVAELSNPAFREKLKSRNLWQRIIDSIANLFGFRKDSSNYAKISKNLSKIIDNYDTNFTKSYENANLESTNIDFAKFLNTKDTPEMQSQANNYATMLRMKARKNDIKRYELFQKIEKSPAFGSKMEIIGTQNLDSETLSYIIARNKRVAINKLDSKVAQELGYKYPNDVRRTIQRDDIIHALREHGKDSIKTQKMGQKPITLDDIANYQNYADNAEIKGFSKDKSGNNILISMQQIDSDFYVVVEQIRKKQNELSFKNLYFGNGDVTQSNTYKTLKLVN